MGSSLYSIQLLLFSDGKEPGEKLVNGDQGKEEEKEDGVGNKQDNVENELERSVDEPSETDPEENMYKQITCVHDLNLYLLFCNLFSFLNFSFIPLLVFVQYCFYG